MPAAAVIPAPLAYINVAAFKELVVGLEGDSTDPQASACVCRLFVVLLHVCKGLLLHCVPFTLRKLEGSTQANVLEQFSME